ncbi:MAG: hypothetical protein ACO3A2_05625 [Bdellovibrionia bacterium]
MFWIMESSGWAQSSINSEGQKKPGKVIELSHPGPHSPQAQTAEPQSVNPEENQNEIVPLLSTPFSDSSLPPKTTLQSLILETEKIFNSIKNLGSQKPQPSSPRYSYIYDETPIHEQNPNQIFSCQMKSQDEMKTFLKRYSSDRVRTPSFPDGCIQENSGYIMDPTSIGLEDKVRQFLKQFEYEGYSLEQSISRYLRDTYRHISYQKNSDRPNEPAQLTSITGELNTLPYQAKIATLSEAFEKTLDQEEHPSFSSRSAQTQSINQIEVRKKWWEAARRAKKGPESNPLSVLKNPLLAFQSLEEMLPSERSAVNRIKKWNYQNLILSAASMGATIATSPMGCCSLPIWAGPTVATASLGCSLAMSGRQSYQIRRDRYLGRIQTSPQFESLLKKYDPFFNHPNYSSDEQLNMCLGTTDTAQVLLVAMIQAGWVGGFSPSATEILGDYSCIGSLCVVAFGLRDNLNSLNHDLPDFGAYYDEKTPLSTIQRDLGIEDLFEGLFLIQIQEKKNGINSLLRELNALLKIPTLSQEQKNQLISLTQTICTQGAKELGELEQKGISEFKQAKENLNHYLAKIKQRQKEKKNQNFNPYLFAPAQQEMQ